MRRKDKEIKDEAEIESILKEATVCRLALCDGHRPYIAAMCFGHADCCLYLHSAKAGRKIELLKKNPDVCFEIDTGIEMIASDSPCRFGMKYKSVVGSGVAHMIEEREKKKEALNCIMEKYSGKRHQFPPEEMEKVAVIEIKITGLTGKKSGY